MTDLKVHNFKDYASHLLVQPNEHDDFQRIVDLPTRERNLIIFVVAFWCGTCIHCIDKINSLFAQLVKKDDPHAPVLMVFDADQHTTAMNQLIADPEHHIRGFPGIIFVKGEKIQSYLIRSVDEPGEHILKMWQAIPE